MPLPTSGLISLDMIATELKIPNTNLELGDTRLRLLAGIPTGAISLSDFYGKTAASSTDITNKEFVFELSTGTLSNYTYAGGFAKKFDSWNFNGTSYIMLDAGSINFTSSNTMKIATSSADSESGMLLGLGGQSGMLIVQVSGDQTKVKSITLSGFPGYSGSADFTSRTINVTGSLKTASNNRKLTEFLVNANVYMSGGYRFSNVRLKFNT